MGIAFIAPSVDPGKSGVGDHCLALAQTLISQGHRSGVISWNSPQPIITEDSVNRVELLHLPNKQTADSKQAASLDWLNAFEADWLSLHFSGYGFHHRGMATELTNMMLPLRRARKLHIMFHEVWIGLECGCLRKHRLLGALQAWTIKRMVRQLKPDVIDTSIGVYQKALRCAGIESQLRPIPSNIPFANIDAATLTSEIKELCNAPFALLFGEVHPNIDYLQAGNFIRAISDRLPTKLRVVHVGGMNVARKQIVEEVCRAAGLASPRFMAYQSPEIISALMQRALFGVSSNPVALWGKSSSLAAMREHDLPVLCIASPWRLRADPNYQPHLPNRCFTPDTYLGLVLSEIEKPRKPMTGQWAALADGFLQQLSAASAVTPAAQ